MQTFPFHSDPGHGWLEVNAADAASVGLSPQSFSKYSYQDGATMYLEEDCDAPKFVRVWERHHGTLAMSDVYSNCNSFIRDLNRIGG